MGAYDSVEKKFLNLEEFTVIAKLPSKEVLLAQLVGTVSGPLRAFMYVIDQLSKRTPVQAGAEASKVEPTEAK